MADATAPPIGGQPEGDERRREVLVRGLEGGGLERERCWVRGSELSVYIYIFVKVTINYPIIYS